MVAFARYVHTDETHYDYVALSPIAAGELVAILPGFYGVSAVDVPAGKIASLRIRGIFQVTKANPATAFTLGQMLEWNGSSGLHVGTGNGTFRVMANSPAGSKDVFVQLNVLGSSGGGGGGGSPSAPTGVVQIKCTGALSTDNAALTAGLAEAAAYGDGVEIQFLPSDNGTHKELNVSIDMAFGMLSYRLRGMPGFKGIVDHSTNPSHALIYTGTALYNPWELSGQATLPVGMARNTHIVSDPSVVPTIGKCYAFWSDDENTDIARHEAAKPQRSIELHRITRQVKERVYRLAITGTGGNFTLTGVGTTANIAVSGVTASSILSAINAVTANQAASWRVELISAGVFRLWAAAGTTNGYSMTCNATGVTGGTATCAIDTTFTAINKWEIEDTTFRPFLTNAKMVEIPMVAGIRIEDLNIRKASGLTPAGSAIALSGALNPVIRNVRLGDELGRGNPGQFYTLYCYGGLAENVWIADHDDPDSTMSDYYGMLEGICNGFRRVACTFGSVRHGFSSGGREQTVGPTTYRYGGSLNPVFDSCMFHTPPQYNMIQHRIDSAPMWDCHPEIARATVQNSLFEVPAFQVGAQVRSQYVTFLNTTFYCAASAYPVLVKCPDFTMIGGEINGGWVCELTAHPNATATSVPLRTRFINVTWRDTFGPALRILSGSDIVLDGCRFLRIGGGYTNTPFTESCAIYVESLYDSASTISITNCHGPKHLNKWFLYAPSLTFGQLYYAHNTGMQTYGGTSIGIARLRRSTGGTDPSGAQGSTITAAVEWEMAYGVLNGHPTKYIYKQKTGHGLTSADKWKPINANHDVYDDTLDEVVNGVLVDVPYEGSTDVDNFYVLAPRPSVLEIPKPMISGTYAAGTDSPKGWWDLSAGKYVPGGSSPGSHANALPILDIHAYTAALCQVSVTPPIQAVGGGGGGGGSSLLWAEKAW